MTVTEIPYHPRYTTNFQGVTKGDELGPCVVCGKAVKAPGVYFVHAVEGGGYVCTPDEDAARFGRSDDLGLQPIGSDCVRKHPELAPYVRKRAN